jgi:hypothetical protein
VPNRFRPRGIQTQQVATLVHKLILTVVYTFVRGVALLFRLFAGAPFGGQELDGLSVFEVLFHDFGYFLFVEAEVPGAGGIDDDVGAVFAEAEAVHLVHPNVPVDALCPQLVFEFFLQGFGSAFLAVAAAADQDVRVVLSYLRLRPRLDLTVPLAVLLCDAALQVKSS